jgi:hypothetical protein
MSDAPTDISPAVAALLVAHWRETPTWRKLSYVNELNQSLKLLGLSDLRRRYPRESHAQLQRRLATRWLGADLADQVYGSIPEATDAAD